MAKKEDYTTDLKSFLSSVEVANHLGEGNYHAMRSHTINILLIGRSQTGKSTIAYNLTDPYSISRTDGYSTTTDPACIPISIFTANNEKFYNVNIIDTPGLKEKRLNSQEGRSDSELLKLAVRCIEDNITFINVVCFVSIMGKTHELDVEVFDYVQEFLGPRYSTNSMLLLTHCDQVGDDIIENYLRDINQHEPTKKILDYCKLGVKCFGTMDYDELAKWQRKPNIQKELVVDTLKRVEVWRNDLIKTLAECPKISTKELEAISQYYREKKEKLHKTLTEDTAQKFEQLQKTMEEERLSQHEQEEQQQKQLKQVQEKLANMRTMHEKLQKQLKKKRSNERVQTKKTQITLEEELLNDSEQNKQKQNRFDEELLNEREQNEQKQKQMEEELLNEREQNEQKQKQMEELLNEREQNEQKQKQLEEELSNMQQKMRDANERSKCLLM